MEELISCCCYLLLLALPLLSLFILLKKSSSRKSPNPPPSPRALPIIGHLHLIKDPLHLSLASLSSRHGPIFSLRLGCRSFVVVSSPSAVEECFTKNDVVLSNRPRTMAGDRVTYNYTAYVWAPFNHVARAVAGKSLVEEGEIGSESGKEKVKRIRGTFSPSLSEGICDYFPILRRVGYKGLERDLISLQGKREEFLQGLIGEVKGKIDGGGRQKSCLIETLLRLQASEPEFYTDDVVKSTVQNPS
ncbi:cytochrome P450- family 81- subfamily K-polypeptide 1 [Striga hermonthica]|uniref:Cytochrome P450- family 81- subfamily K-polypeptide 1 n=1 Tax=Striga hermonthica TaxID=68872 RepID=A0A9N7N349_STRHE|nr:cytochrome P450- family 81- subfamily K-polypeptide 1 [Striga hermonthica]